VVKSPDSYMASRFNATKYSIQHDGPIPCLGVKCRYRYCEAGQLHPSGGHCAHESEYARRLEVDFRDRWNMLTITPDVDDFEDLVTEFVNINLQRGRAMTRMNRSWTMRTKDGRRDPASTKEFDLADLYLNRLRGRQERLDATLQAGLDRMRERAERLRPHLQVIELFVVGKKRAAEEASKPRRPLWDDFIDGDPATP